MVEMAMFNVQRVITPNVAKQLWFMCSVHHGDLHLCEVS